MQRARPTNVATRPEQFLALLKRRFLRTPAYLEGVIRPLVMDAPVKCVIRELSDGGAKLQVTHAAIPIPSLFDLDIPSRGERKRCYLVWRSKDTLGVEFVERW